MGAISFSADFNVNGHHKQFQFTRTEVDYEVSVPGDPAVPPFHMIMDEEGIWYFLDKALPAWVVDLEMELGDIIEEHEVV